LLLGICFLCEMVVPLPNAVYPAVVIMGCMPCGLNTIVFPSLVGEDCRMGAKFVLLSHVLCLASIPLWIWIVT
jgi:predicted permease